MADNLNQTEEGSYGYETDEGKQNPFVFGLNAGVCRLEKFEFTPTGGAGGTDQEALDIVFNINGIQKGYRKFPVTKAFNKDGVEVTDPNSKEIKDAKKDLNSVIVHILHAFLPDEIVKKGLSVPIRSFKDFCIVAAALLPRDFATRPLDIFLQYQWSIPSGKDRSYLDIPKKMAYGSWLCPARPGTWKEMRADDINAKTTKALWYVNENGEEHPFVKNGWFMTSNFAVQQRDNSASGNTDTSAADSQIAGTTSIELESMAIPPAASW